MKPAPWTALDLLRAIGWTLLVGVAPALAVIGSTIVAARLGHSIRDWPYRFGVFSALLALLVYGGMFFAVYRVTIRKYELPWSELFFRPASPASYLATVALFLPMELGLGLVSALFRAVARHPMPNPQEAIFTGIPHNWVNFAGFMLGGVILAPLVEETVFRGFLYRLLRKKLPVWLSIVVSAAIFAAVHGIPTIFPMLFYLGIVLGLVVERTGSIYCSIALHAMQNAAAITVLFTASKG